MIPVFGCETARELLEPFIDGELSTDEQVAVQSHLRTCGTCAARVEDLSLIGWSVRTGPPAVGPSHDDEQALAVIQSGVLTRIRAERAQALRTRLSEMFADMRLLWPALGGTVAVLICLFGAVHIWQLTMHKSPDSVAGKLEAIARAGSDSNPLQLDDEMSFPRALDEGVGLASAFGEDALVRVIVGTSGRVTHAEAAALPETPDGQAMLKALREQRFSPANRGGRAVAVEAMLYITHVTAVPSRLMLDSPLPRVPTAPKADVEASQAVPAGVVGSRSPGLHPFAVFA